jgi:Heterokaryon incompatibility protein (HET)
MTGRAPNEELKSLYSPLPLEPDNEIRLMRILATETEVIACELLKVSLRENPEYVALSYTWGPSTNEQAARGISSTPSRPILCNNRQILVTENLHAFLVRARENPLLASRYIWIDAICINQEDPLERTSQVCLMATIYHSADTVVVWLGEDDEDTERGFDLIRVLGRCCDECLTKITPKNLGSEEMLGILGPLGDKSSWKSVAKLFQRRYFVRVWIIQEITLAKTVLALCGKHFIDWDDVIKVSKFLTVTSWTRWICPARVLPAPDSPQSNHAIPSLLEANKRTRNRGDKDIMLHFLIRSRRFEASDPRDKVYALLGIAGNSVRGKLRYAPVYGERSEAETYTDTAIQILEDSDDLLLLACAEGQNFRTIPSLSSWVPDWNCSRVLGLGVTGYRRYSAAAGLPRSLIINERTRSLIVKGVKLDNIVLIGETKHEILTGKLFPQWLSILSALPHVYHNGQARSEVFWRTLITDTAGTPPCHPASSDYGPACFSWILSKLATYINEIAEHTEGSSFFKNLDALAATGTAECLPSSNNILSFHRHGQSPKNIIVSDEYEVVFSHTPHLRLFLTSRRYLGVGSESLLEQDSIWIIAGSPIPLILRELGVDTFQLVGGAYVHGFMKGEALESDHSFEDITIV